MHEEFARDLGGGCRFVAHVMGTIRVIAPSNASMEPSVQYEPALHLSARLTCAHGQAEHAVSFDLRGAQYARAQLAQAVGEQLWLSAYSGDRLCTYRPRFTFDGNTVRGDDVTQSCISARGGGPSPGATRTSPRVPVTPSVRSEQAFPGVLGVGAYGTPAPGVTGNSQRIAPIAPQPPSARGGGPPTPREVIENTDTRQDRTPVRPGTQAVPPDSFRGTGRDLNGEGGPYGVQGVGREGMPQPLP